MNVEIIDDNISFDAFYVKYFNNSMDWDRLVGGFSAAKDQETGECFSAHENAVREQWVAYKLGLTPNPFEEGVARRVKRIKPNFTKEIIF